MKKDKIKKNVFLLNVHRLNASFVPAHISTYQNWLDHQPELETQFFVYRLMTVIVAATYHLLHLLV